MKLFLCWYSLDNGTAEVSFIVSPVTIAATSGPNDDKLKDLKLTEYDGLH